LPLTEVSDGVAGKFDEIANGLQVFFTCHSCGVVISASDKPPAVGWYNASWVAKAPPIE
jgi:hypothetical protein